MRSRGLTVSTRPDQDVGTPLGRARVYLPAANVYPQDELRGVRKGELLRVDKVGTVHSSFSRVWV
jgi:hypothetical protein